MSSSENSKNSPNISISSPSVPLDLAWFELYYKTINFGNKDSPVYCKGDLHSCLVDNCLNCLTDQLQCVENARSTPKYGRFWGVLSEIFGQKVDFSKNCTNRAGKVNPDTIFQRTFYANWNSKISTRFYTQIWTNPLKNRTNPQIESTTRVF